MNKHELCQTCKPHKHCLFEKAANDIANSVLPKEQQTPLITYEDVTIEALRAHKEISLLRDLAKLCGCPNANKVNPDYPGKDKPREKLLIKFQDLPRAVSRSIMG